MGEMEKTQRDSLGTYTMGGRNVRASEYDTGGYLTFEDRARWVGELSGSWYEIGRAIGEKCGDLITASSDYWWEKMCAQKGRDASVAAMDRYAEQTDALDPTQIPLIKGMADGAAKALEAGRFGNTADEAYADPVCRVMAAGIFDCWLWGDPDSYRRSGAGANRSAGEYIDGGCNSVAAKGSAVRGGATISSQVRHTQKAGLCYQASMVYRGENSHAVWTVGNVPASNGLLVVNDRGVSISHHFGGSTTQESLSCSGGPCYGSAYGVPWPGLVFYAAKTAGTAREAIDILAHGSERYRKITGRKTVLRDGTWNWMVCDPGTLAVVEAGPDRYAVRYAGEFTGEDWTDPDYIVCANHFLCPYSYDENDRRTDVPMTVFNSNTTSQARFWTLMWEMKDYKGKLDVLTLQYLFSQTYLRDRETGEHIRVMKNADGILMPAGEAYACAQGTLTNGGLDRGTNAAKIAVLQSDASECYFCQGNPMDWQGDWDRYRFGT